MKKINFNWKGVQFLNSQAYRNNMLEHFTEIKGRIIYSTLIGCLKSEKPDIDYLCNTVVKESERWAEANLEEIKNAAVENYDLNLILLSADEFIFSIKDDEYWIIFFYAHHNGVLFINPAPENIEHPLLVKAKNIICWLQNQQHDIVYVNHARKEYIGNAEPEIFNLSGHPINIINTRLNKTVVHDEPFPVNGFWRKQRCGKGNAYVKEIFVNAFTKNGYRRTYGKLAA